jgi:hypothetical protein
VPGIFGRARFDLGEVLVAPRRRAFEEILWAWYEENRPAKILQPRRCEWTSSARRLTDPSKDHYYYRRSKRTVEDALVLGVHSLRIAHELKASYIGEPSAWVYREGIFRRLTGEELGTYIAMSKSLDASILDYAP